MSGIQRETRTVLRWTGLAAALIVSAPSIAQEASSADPVVVEADNIYQNEADNTVIAEGNVQAAYEGRVLKADRVVYNRDTDRVRATGNVVIIDPDGTQRFSDEIEVSSNLADGYAVGFSARLPNGGIATANAAVRQTDGITALDQVIYTACEVCEDDDTPTWSLRARKAVLDEEEGMIAYRDAVLEIAGIPVFYIPFFTHPDPNSDRRSGLLPPDFGLSDKLGAFYQQPYYWAISEHQDLTISPKLMTGVNPLLQFEYRKRFWRGELEIDTSFTYENDFDSDGDEFGDEEFRSHLYAKGLFDLADKWQWGFGLEWQQDDLYTRRYDIEGENERRGLYDGQPRRLLSQLYLVGQDTDFYADASLLRFQGLRAGDDDDELPLASPLFFAEKLYSFGNLGQASIAASGAVLSRGVGADSRRVSLGGEWSATRVLPGGLLLEPFAEARADYFGLDEDVSGEGDVTRGVGSVGARVSYPLVRTGENVNIVLEPTIMAALSTANNNNSAIPLEDSLLFEFDESNLFEANGVSGFDRYEGGGKLAAGLTARAKFKQGPEISGIIGQRWRTVEDEAFDVSSNLAGDRSDIVAGLAADFGRPLRFDVRTRFGDNGQTEDGFALNRIDASISTNFSRIRANARYYRIDENVAGSGNEDQGIDLKASFRVTDNYSFIYGIRRDIAGTPTVVRDPFTGAITRDPITNEIITVSEPRDLQHSFGVAYEDDCSRFEIAFSRSEAIDRTIGPNDSIQFRFSLKTLGDFGSGDLD